VSNQAKKSPNTRSLFHHGIIPLKLVQPDPKVLKFRQYFRKLDSVPVGLAKDEAEAWLVVEYDGVTDVRFWREKDSEPNVFYADYTRGEWHNEQAN